MIAAAIAACSASEVVLVIHTPLGFTYSRNEICLSKGGIFVTKWE